MSISPDQQTHIIQAIEQRARPNYLVSDDELRPLAGIYGPLNSVFFGVALGAAVSLAMTVVTVDLDDRAFATFVSLLALSVGASAYFGVRMLIDLRAARRRIARLRSGRRAGP